jgi:hypothetical protein
MGIRQYLDTGFEVWTVQRTWFWSVENPDRNGGSVGAAATEAEAIHEARLSIEEISAQRRASEASHVTARNTFTPCHESNSIESAAIGWECSLASLEKYLTGLCGAGFSLRSP